MGRLYRGVGFARAGAAAPTATAAAAASSTAAATARHWIHARRRDERGGRRGHGQSGLRERRHRREGGAPESRAGHHRGVHRGRQLAELSRLQLEGHAGLRCQSGQRQRRRHRRRDPHADRDDPVARRSATRRDIDR